MSFAKIDLRNIPRRKLRNSLTIIGIIIAIALPVGVDIAAESSFVEFRSYIVVDKRQNRHHSHNDLRRRVRA